MMYLCGEVVNKENSVGCESEYELVHLNLLLFVDEVGSNTSQAKDGKVGGDFFCVQNTADHSTEQQQRILTSQYKDLQLPLVTLLCVQ